MSRTRLYEVSGFVPFEAPHWGTAYIEAASPEDAKAVLLTILSDEKTRPETVWGDGDDGWGEADWKATEVTHPFRFVLGGGCR